MIVHNAPMVKWISQQSSELLLWVRILLGAQMKKEARKLLFSSVLAGGRRAEAGSRVLPAGKNL